MAHCSRQPYMKQEEEIDSWSAVQGMTNVNVRGLEHHFTGMSFREIAETLNARKKEILADVRKRSGEAGEPRTPILQQIWERYSLTHAEAVRLALSCGLSELEEVAHRMPEKSRSEDLSDLFKQHVYVRDGDNIYFVELKLVTEKGIGGVTEYVEGDYTPVGDRMYKVTKAPQFCNKQTDLNDLPTRLRREALDAANDDYRPDPCDCAHLDEHMHTRYLDGEDARDRRRKELGREH